MMFFHRLSMYVCALCGLIALFRCLKICTAVCMYMGSHIHILVSSISHLAYIQEGFLIYDCWFYGY